MHASEQSGYFQFHILIFSNLSDYCMCWVCPAKWLNANVQCMQLVNEVHHSIFSIQPSTVCQFVFMTITEDSVWTKWSKTAHQSIFCLIMVWGYIQVYFYPSTTILKTKLGNFLMLLNYMCLFLNLDTSCKWVRGSLLIDTT